MLHLVRTKVKRLTVATFIYRHLQGNPDQQRFTMRSGVLTGNDTGGAAQVAAAHCPNERTRYNTIQEKHLCCNVNVNNVMSIVRISGVDIQGA